jgi:hypothetical protein
MTNAPVAQLDRAPAFEARAYYPDLPQPIQLFTAAIRQRAAGRVAGESPRITVGIHESPLALRQALRQTIRWILRWRKRAAVRRRLFRGG